MKGLFILALFYGATFFAFGQGFAVSGTITDASDGSPLPGATVLIKGTTTGTAADQDGKFQITAQSGDVLVFSFIGYKDQEITLGNRTTLNVEMEAQAFSVKEVVAIGYGTTKREDATGSVSTVSSDDFNRGAITSPQELVIGKIAGVQITNAGGAPGAGVTIRIRGGSSLSASNDPLIVIDGVPVDNEGVAGMRNPLNTIQPDDIATFTVLKDASATAIYGSRASNGVILITTKKGKKNQPFSVTYNGTVSLDTKTRGVNILNADEFRAIVQNHFETNQNATDLLGSANTNWQNVIRSEEHTSELQSH